MGREIDIKIPVSDSVYDYIRSVIFGQKKVDDIDVVLKSLMRIEKSDEYYSRYDTQEERRAIGEPQVIRIRSERYENVPEISSGNINSENKLADSDSCCDIDLKPKSFFCIKRKAIAKGIEFNSEDETYIENPDVLRDLLLFSGYHVFFAKKKNALSVNCRSSVLPDVDFHVELEMVNGLKFIEIEVTDDKIPADTVRASLEKFVRLFGLNPEDRVSKSWMEILKA